jgi:hypothetical protein
VALAEVAARRALGDPELKANFADWSAQDLRAQAMGMAAVSVCARLEDHVARRAKAALPDWSEDARRKLRPTGRNNSPFKSWFEAIAYGFDASLDETVVKTMRELLDARNSFADSGGADPALTLLHAESWAKGATVVAQAIELGIQGRAGGWTDASGKPVSAKPPPRPPE